MITETTKKETLFTTREIRTFTGKYVDVFSPTAEMIDIEDIAHALSHVCRWGGHTPVFYSVAEHSIACAKRGQTREQIKALLLHDATEAYLMDMPRPIKYHLPDYQKAEDVLMRVIADKFKITYPFESYVKTIDREMLILEWDELILGSNRKGAFECFSPMAAKQEFLDLFSECY